LLECSERAAIFAGREHPVRDDALTRRNVA
jgi:hypothetical protein